MLHHVLWRNSERTRSFYILHQDFWCPQSCFADCCEFFQEEIFLKWYKNIYSIVLLFMCLFVYSFYTLPSLWRQAQGGCIVYGTLVLSEIPVYSTNYKWVFKWNSSAINLFLGQLLPLLWLTLDGVTARWSPFPGFTPKFPGIFQYRLATKPGKGQEFGFKFWCP